MNLNDYILSIKEKKIGVIGISVSNTPWIKLLLMSGCSVTACDKRTVEQMGMEAFELINMGAKLRLGDSYLDKLDFDVIFRTPGLMPFDEHLENAAKNGAVITSEMEVFMSLCPCRIIAVTGSDGKTTTTTVISELLKEGGYTVHVGGNIGKPLLCELPYIKASDIVVLELSSFQLHSMYCKTDVAVITNISPNHLDKHKDYEDYIEAKCSIFLNQLPDSCLVLNRSCEFSAGFESRTKGVVRYFNDKGTEANGAFEEDGKLYRVKNGEREFVIDAEDIRIPGQHNVQNYLAAYAATSDFVSAEVCANVAREFKGVEHRLEQVRELNGITFINDSIASSPSRTGAGLRAVRTKPIIILGGYDKKIPFDGLGEDLCLYAQKVFLTGATAEKIREAIVNAPSYSTSPVPVTVIDDFKETVHAAYAAAEPGDLVVLSPACAAFDKFKNFAERGKIFKQIVMELN